MNALSTSTPPATTEAAGPALRLRGGDAPLPSDCPSVHQAWCDLPAQIQHCHCCRTSEERELLSVAGEKVSAPFGNSYGTYWKRTNKWTAYDTTACIICCSNYNKKKDFIHCGYQCVYGSFQCQDRLCPRCSYRRLTIPLLAEFGNSFSAENEVFFIVVSLSRNRDETHRLIFRDFDSSDFDKIKAGSLADPCSPNDYGVEFMTQEDLTQCRLVFQFIAEAIRKFTGKGGSKFFSGAVGGPELAVRFQPLRVVPHANYLVWSSGFTIDDARKLREFIRNKMRYCRGFKKGIYPTLSCIRIASGDDLRRVAQYIVKPIGLAAAYRMAADIAHCEPAKMASLNCETNLFLENLPCVFLNLHRISRHGRCNAVDHDYIGDVTFDRLQRRELDAERRKERGYYDLTVGQPAQSKRSPLERWDEQLRLRSARRGRPRRGRFDYWLQAMERRKLPSPSNISRVSQVNLTGH